MAQVGLTQPNVAKFDLSQIGSLQLCGIELAITQIRASNLDVVEIGTIEAGASSDQDRDRIGGSDTPFLVYLRPFDVREEFLLEPGLLLDTLCQKLKDGRFMHKRFRYKGEVDSCSMVNRPVRDDSLPTVAQTLLEQVHIREWIDG